MIAKIARFYMMMAVLFGTADMQAQEVISLAGAWDFSMEQPAAQGEQPAPQGNDNSQFSIHRSARSDASLAKNSQFSDYVILPGSMLTNGKGDQVSVHTQWTGSLYDSSFYFNPYMEKYRKEGQMKFPFFLTPERHFVGKAWYHRTVYVPKDWKDQRVTLFLERAHIETTVWVNGQEAGHQMSLSTPHRYDVTKMIRAGEKNDITICVYNGIENVCVGQDSHSVTDQTQGNWNGIVGRIELQAQWERVNISRVKILPDAKKKKVKVSVELGAHIPSLRVLPLYDYDVTVTVAPLTGNGNTHYRSKDAEGSLREFEIDLGADALLWDEFYPNLYRLTVHAGDDVYEANFGLRDISVEGRQLLLNGRPLYLRGTVENCCFPLTGYPPMDEEEWMRIFVKCKEYGLNHVRFHSYCPPEAAFAAADRVGIYLQPEGPSWPNHGVRLRRKMAIDQYLLEESKRIVDEYGHHPSFVMMAAGNEPAGDWVSYCNDWVKEMKQYDPSKIYAGASVGGGWAWDGGSEYHVKGGARGLDEWNRRAPSSDDDYYSGIEYPRNYKDTMPNQSPIVTHEKGQWCAFPDFKEIEQYTGAYKAANFEVFRDLLRDNGMETQAEKFLKASGKLQTLCYKYEIERNLRTKDYAGFQLLGLNDYSGQGTALTGVLNVFWREKGYCTAQDWTQFCNVVVPLARFPKFVYTTADTLVVPVEVYNAYSTPLSGVRPTYYIGYDSLHVLQGGLLSSVSELPIGKNLPLGTVRMPLDSVKAPCKLTLTVSVSGVFKNQWDFWVYNKTENGELRTENGELRTENGELRTENGELRTERYDYLRGEKSPEHANSSSNHTSQFSILNSQLYVTDTLDAKTEKVLAKGGRVLLLAAGKVTLGSDVKQTYLPVFWNTSWFKMRPPHTTGATIDVNHPLFKYDFPTDDWANLNWWELLNKAQVMNLMELPKDYQSPIQPIDTWHVSRKLGMLIEARVGKGLLLMTTMDLDSHLEQRPVARQMRQAIIRYMESNDFQPAIETSLETIRHFFTKQAPAVNMFTNDSPDELKPKIK